MAEDVTYNAYLAVRDLLRANITDPRGRGDPTWIRKVFPRKATEDDFPLITINQITTAAPMLSLGDASQRFIASLQIEVWVKEGKDITINGEKFRGGRLRDRIAGDVLNEMQTNKNIAPRIYRVENTRFEDIDFENENEVIRKSMDFDIYYRWVK